MMSEVTSAGDPGGAWALVEVVTDLGEPEIGRCAQATRAIKGYALAMLAATGGRLMARRLTIGLIATASALLLVGCGNSTITLTAVSNGVTVSIVVTSDSNAIAALKSNPAVRAGGTIQEGDDHVGSHICGFSVSKGGHTYQVDYYDTGALSNSSPTELCGTIGQQSFLSQAP